MTALKWTARGTRVFFTDTAHGRYMVTLLNSVNQRWHTYAGTTVISVHDDADAAKAAAQAHFEARG